MQTWTKEETTLALALYYKLPFSQTTKNNVEIIKLAKLLNRTPSSIAMKLGNFGSLDPALGEQGIVGLKNSSKQDKEIWNHYYNNLEELANDNEKILNTLKKENIHKDIYDYEIDKDFASEDKLKLTKIRTGQSFFRSMILGLYNNKCCVTGITIPCFLEAAHIIKWSEDKYNRLNPTNGICLNSFFHKAYDNYIVSVTPDYQFTVNENLLAQDNSNLYIYKLFMEYNNKTISVPDKYKPNRDFLKLHYENFRKSL